MTGAKTRGRLPPSDAAAPPEESARQVVAAFLDVLRRSEDWFPALLRAIAGWEEAEEVWQGRRYRYLIGGEAFDWLLLAERLLAEAGDLVPEAERTRLLFHSEAPELMDAQRFREAIGPQKHRAHLNFWYGVVVEEAVRQATLEEAVKAHLNQALPEEALEDEAFQHLYDAPYADLLAEFRRASGLPDGESSLDEQRAFTYWLFKRRLAKSDPARLASDTRKGLLWLYLRRPAAWRWVEGGAREG